MANHRTFLLRSCGLLMVAGAVFVVRENSTRLEAQQTRTGSAEDARDLCARLLRDYPDALDEASEAELTDTLKLFGQASRTAWLMGSTRTSLTPQQVREGLAKADAFFGEGVRRAAAAVTRIPGRIRLSGEPATPIDKAMSMPFGTAVLVVDRQSAAGPPPRFEWKKVDLNRAEAVDVDVATMANFICALELTNPPRPAGRVRLRLTAGGQLLSTIRLAVTVPPQIPLRVEIRDGAGPTEAAVGLYSARKRFLIPATALDFSGAGYNYAPVNFRDHGNAKFWPGGAGFTRCFFVRGGFTIDVPPGSYRLIVSKGPEYLPVDRVLSVSAGGAEKQTVELRRWIDMAARGWHSGDTHIHFARPNPQANERVALWARAEDLHVGNILRMGDAQETYFEQYAYGRPGRFVYRRGALVPGQEDPRTGVLGHTISLNILRPIRDAERRYYLYSTTFDEAHRQGGLSGYAHVNSDSFLVHRDLTLNVPRGKVDFGEICEFGEVGTDLYYEFLNLGFRLTAVGGSDAPWGGTVGDSRVYVHTDAPLDPDQWFAALKQGRTFVTAGPMLEFTVNDQLPGGQLVPGRGARLKIHARASAGSGTAPLNRLEVVANGVVVRSAEASGNSAALDFELPAQRSIWIAARTVGAHTTPVYVTVDGKRHWNLALVPGLLDKRLRTLDDIDRLIAQKGEGIFPARAPEWENPEAFRRGSAELHQMVQEAREVYLHLQKEAATQR